MDTACVNTVRTRDIFGPVVMRIYVHAHTDTHGHARARTHTNTHTHIQGRSKHVAEQTAFPLSSPTPQSHELARVTNSPVSNGTY